MTEPTSEPTAADPDPLAPLRTWLSEQRRNRVPPGQGGLYHWDATLEQYEALRTWPHLAKVGGKMEGEDVVAIGVKVKRPAA
jgi:hypothetical protein